MKRLNGKVSSLIKSQKPIAVYGIGNHTDLLFKATDISQANITYFVDTHQGGRGLSYKDRPIMAPTDIGEDIKEIIISSFPFQEEIFEYLINVNFKGDIFKIYRLEKEELLPLEKKYSPLSIKQVEKLFCGKRKVAYVIDIHVDLSYIYLIYTLKMRNPDIDMEIISLHKGIVNIFKDFLLQYKIKISILSDIIQDQSLNNEIYKEHEFFSNDREFTSLKLPDSDLPLWKSIYYDHIVYSMRGNYWLHKPLREMANKLKFDFLITTDTRNDCLATAFQTVAQEKKIPVLKVQLGNIRNKMEFYLPLRAHYFLPKFLSDKIFIENNKKEVQVLEPYFQEPVWPIKDKKPSGYPEYITTFIDVNCQWELGQFLKAIIEFEENYQDSSKSIQWQIIVKKNYNKDLFSEEEFCKILYHQLLAQISDVQFVEVEKGIEEVIDSIKLFISLSYHPYVQAVQNYRIPVVIFDLYNYNLSKDILINGENLVIITRKEDLFSYFKQYIGGGLTS